MNTLNECEIDYLLDSMQFKAREGCSCTICEHVRSGDKEPYFFIDIEEFE